jgi:VanZ family protein
MIFKKLLPAIIWTLFILLITLTPGNYFPEVPNFLDLFQPDKIVHILIYGTLTFLTSRGLIKQYSSKLLRYNAISIGFVYSVLLGGVVEILQTAMKLGRYGSIYDFIANSVGCLIAVLIIRKYQKTKFFAY